MTFIPDLDDNDLTIQQAEAQLGSLASDETVVLLFLINFLNSVLLTAAQDLPEPRLKAVSKQELFPVLSSGDQKRPIYTAKVDGLLRKWNKEAGESMVNSEVLDLVEVKRHRRDDPVVMMQHAPKMIAYMA